MDLRRHQVEELRWGLGDERLEQRPVLRVKQILKIKWEIAGAHNHAENSYSISFRGSLGAEMRGRSAFCDYMRRVREAFPDFHNEIEEMIAKNDRVVARLSYTGTHRGEIFGVAPTGKKIKYAGAAFFRIANGRIAKGWVLGDIAGLLAQIGARVWPPQIGVKKPANK